MTDHQSTESPARRAEIVFETTEAVESRYDARIHHLHAGRGPDNLKGLARDAVLCDFDEDGAPRVIRLHFVREEAIAV